MILRHNGIHVFLISILIFGSRLDITYDMLILWGISGLGMLINAMLIKKHVIELFRLLNRLVMFVFIRVFNERSRT